MSVRLLIWSGSSVSFIKSAPTFLSSSLIFSLDTLSHNDSIVTATSKTFQIQADVLQESVLGPLLYRLYTADISTTARIHIATYTDDTAILASYNRYEDATKKSSNLGQCHSHLGSAMKN